jgi:hypothetical protein
MCDNKYKEDLGFRYFQQGTNLSLQAISRLRFQDKNNPKSLCASLEMTKENEACSSCYELRGFTSSMDVTTLPFVISSEAQW